MGRLPKKLWSDASAEQKERSVEEPWLHVLEARLGDKEGKIRAEDVWALLGMADPKSRAQHDNARTGEAMRALGWQRKQLRFGGPKEWAYWKGSDPLRRLHIHQDGPRPHDWKVTYQEDGTY